MSIQFRNYTKEIGITDDYFKVRQFLIDLKSTEYTYARWDWMITHGYLDKDYLGHIGLWEDSGRVVGIATYDTKVGYAYCLTFSEYDYLKKEMLLYAKDNLSDGDQFKIVISDSDHYFQKIASELGFIATENKESHAIFYLDQTSTDYTLPEGYKITTMKDSYDLYQYYRLLWKGFNHEVNGEGEFTFTKKEEDEGTKQMIRPNVDLSLKVAVVAPDGNFVSYCGMWYDKETDLAVIEPVATIPEYRKMGLGKAAVLEGIKRVGDYGAKAVLVGSSQQFYYSIGMRPFSTATEWIYKSIN